MRLALAGLPLLAAALPVPAAAAGGASYPSAAVLEAFSLACSQLDSLALAKEEVIGAGWTGQTPTADSQLGRLIAMGKDMADMDEAPTLAFHKSVAGRELDLVLSEAADGEFGVTGRGCRVYDFAATVGITDKEARAWAGRKPDSAGDAAGMKSMKWEPGVTPGHAATQITFFPQGSAAGAAFHLTGVGLMTQVFTGGSRPGVRESESE